MTFGGKRVLVVGLGASGWSAARALVDLEATVQVTEASDGPLVRERAGSLRALGAEVEIGGHTLDGLDADIAVVSPGIPPSSDILRALEHSEIPVISEVELAFQLARCDFLAVTGTNGKTTTTSLLAAMLAEAGVPSAAAGNIGLPLIDAVAYIPEGGAIAVEVSSFQLAGTISFHPRVAVLLNIAEDHTDWHGSMDAYIEAKSLIARNQTADDVFVVNRDDERAWAVSETVSAAVVPFTTGPAPAGGIGIDAGNVVWSGQKIMARDDISLSGRAGLEDTLAAAGAALSYGIPAETVRTACVGFRPLRHRMEVVTEHRGVTYINDSKATNPHATLAAVVDLQDVVLIAGGRAKGIDLAPLRATVPPVIAVVAIGEASDEVEKVFDGLVEVVRASTMAEAVAAGMARSRPGGSVLLAPGCASLDMYENYSARGDDFARSVKGLIAATDEEGGVDGDA